MSKYFIFSFFCVASLISTISTLWEINIASGYREDHLKWRLQNPGEAFTTYREDYSNLKFMECELAFQKITRDIIFYIDGGYAFIGKDEMKQSGFNLDFTTVPVMFSFDTDANAAKGSTYLGYVVQLTPDRHYEVNVVPLFGFTIHYEKIKRKDPHPNPFESTQIENASLFTIQSNLSNKDLRQKWYGAFIGLNFFARPGGGKFSFGSGYRYNFLSFRQSFSSDILINTFDGDMILSQQERLMHAKASRNGNHGHSGYLKLSSYPSKYFKLSLLGNVYYFSSETFTVNVANQIINLFPTFSNTTFNEAQKLKNRWLIFEILLQLSFYI